MELRYDGDLFTEKDMVLFAEYMESLPPVGRVLLAQELLKSIVEDVGSDPEDLTNMSEDNLTVH